MAKKQTLAELQKRLTTTIEVIAPRPRQLKGQIRWMKGQIRWLELRLREKDSLIRVLEKQRDDALRAVTSRANYRKNLEALDTVLRETEAAIATVQRIFSALGGGPRADV